MVIGVIRSLLIVSNARRPGSIRLTTSKFLSLGRVPRVPTRPIHTRVTVAPKLLSKYGICPQSTMLGHTSQSGESRERIVEREGMEDEYRHQPDVRGYQPATI